MGMILKDGGEKCEIAVRGLSVCGDYGEIGRVERGGKSSIMYQ